MTNDANATLNLATINELTDILDDGVYDLFEEYLRNTEQLLKQLDTAGRQGDIEGVQRIAHTLKGSSGNLGIANVYRLSEALERAALDRDDLALSQQKVKELEYAYVLAQKALMQRMPEKN